MRRARHLQLDPDVRLQVLRAGRLRGGPVRPGTRGQRPGHPDHRHNAQDQAVLQAARVAGFIRRGIHTHRRALHHTARIQVREHLRYLILDIGQFDHLF